MVSKGAQPGNTNAVRGKQWRDALRKKLALFADEENKIVRGQALDGIAEVVVKQALAGNKDAIQEIGNRLDGKPHQSMDISTVAARAEDLSDDELADIIRRGSARTSDEAENEAEPTSIH